MPRTTRAVESLRALPCGSRLLDALGGREDVWLVGGAVRDLLTGREPRELDLVTESDVEAVAAQLGATVVERHERFGTVRAVAGVCAYDIARARTETYDRPGALPDVVPATLREDLRRRDFTVNALALSLGGELLAVPDGLEDLGARRLRVLHQSSFVDDPTRLWRLARYAARMGFAVEEHTERWAREAVAGGALETVSADRVGSEVRLALGEPDPLAALEQAARLGLADLDIDRERVRRALALLPEDGRADLLVLAAVAPPGWSPGLSPAEERVLGRARELELPSLAVPASQRARALRGEPLEAVALAGGPVAEWWIHEGRHVRLEIGGADLLAGGVAEGPQVGERLARVLDRKLDGEVAGREAELRAALE